MPDLPKFCPVCGATMAECAGSAYCHECLVTGRQAALADDENARCPKCGKPLTWVLAGTANGDLVSAKHAVAYCAHCKRAAAAQRLATLDPRQVGPAANVRQKPI